MKQSALFLVASSVTLIAAHVNVTGLNFAGLGAPQEEGTLVAPSFLADLSKPSFALTPTATENAFNSLDGHYDAARVNANEIESTDSRVVATRAVPSVVPHGEDDTNKNVRTDVAAMSFLALPVSADEDVQGFPFAGRASSGDEDVAAAVTNAAAGDDDGWWRERVCSASSDACSLVPVRDTDHLQRRRLTTSSSTDGRQSLQNIKDALQRAMAARVAAALLVVAIEFASAPFALVLTMFSLVLSALTAASAQDAFIALLKSVNAEYSNVNKEMTSLGHRIGIAANIVIVREKVKNAISYQNQLLAIYQDRDHKSPDVLRASVRSFCHHNNYHEFMDPLVKYEEIKAWFHGFFETRSGGYVAESAFYLKGLLAVYMSSMQCKMVSTTNLETLKTDDQSFRNKIAKVAFDMAATAAKMRVDMAANISAEITAAIDDGGSKVDVAPFADKYDWLVFKAIRSDMNVCADEKADVINSNCGLITISASACHFVGWYNKWEHGEMQSGIELDKTYRALSSDWQCGFGSEEVAPTVRTKPPTRRLARARQNARFTVYVKGNRMTASVPTEFHAASESAIDSAVIRAAEDPLQDQLNSAKNERERMKILAENYNSTSAMSQSIKSRDLSVWFTLETNLKEVSDMYKERGTMVDGISTTVKDVHEVEMGRATGLYDDLVATGALEVEAMTALEAQTTGQFNNEVAEMDAIDGQLTQLSSSLGEGFRATTSDLDTVEHDTTAALHELSSTVKDTGAKTRTEVKRVIEQALQKTLDHLDGLGDLITTKSTEKLGAVRGLDNFLDNAGRQLRNGVSSEFSARAHQLQQRVASLSGHITTVGSITVTALVSETDAMRTEIGRRISFLTKQLEVIDGQITVSEKILSTINAQVDDVLGLIASLNTRLTTVFRTMRDLPDRIRQVVMVKTVEDKFRDGERLSFAYANYIKHSMNQLQAFEFIQQCDVVGEMVLFDNLLERLKRGEAVLQKELAMFNNSRIDYEQFGNRIAAAAYHLRFMLIPCANMRTLKQTGRAELGESTSRAFADKLSSAIWTFQQSIEETVPQLFLKKIYSATYLLNQLVNTRQSTTANGNYSLAAIESLRYLFQQQLGTFASVSVIQPDQKSRLSVWSKATKLSIGASRYGLLRLSTILPTVAAGDELLVLWSNTRQHIPNAQRNQFNIPLKRSDLASDTTLSAAFKNTPYELFWAAGLVQSVVFVERVNNSTCPWSIAAASYPYCWETGAYNEGGCVCVQIEGLAPTVDASKMEASDGPTPWALQTTIAGNHPRANFLISAVNKSSAIALATTTMVSVPENRRAFAVCMTSELPRRECIPGWWCHQPPPSYTRCIANPTETYNIVHAADSSAQVFIKDGLSVTAEMFRSLELGPGIPDITLFDEPNGQGGYIVCTDCSMEIIKSIYMFRVMSFKIGRPALEKASRCRQHPRFKSVEFCMRGSTPSLLWTPQTMLQGELVQSIQRLASSLPAHIEDPHELAIAVNTRVQSILSEDTAYVKVYVAKSGSFNTTANGSSFWTNLPTQAAGLERGWTVVPGFYSTVISENVVAFDALVMWSTLAVETRSFAQLVVEKKPSNQSLKQYLQSRFGAYARENILRGFFSEPFDGLDCPVAGDTDHFAYCTPVPVDKMCSCVQLEDLPQEYMELYDGTAPNGKVVSYVVEADESVYVVGRSKGNFSLGGRVPSVTWDGLPMRNVSDRSVCVSDYNHPELGATCVFQAPSGDNGTDVLDARMAFTRVQAGAGVSAVTITTSTWTAQCTGCSEAFVSEISAFGDTTTKSTMTVTSVGPIVGGSCRKSAAEGGGEIHICLNQNSK